MNAVAESLGRIEGAFSGVARMLAVATLLSSVAACAGAAPAEQPAPTNAVVDDPRVGLEAGWRDAGVAAENMELIAHRDRPEGFYDPNALGNLMLGNSDLAFRDEYVFVGNFNGFNIYDISNPADPQLQTSFVCPGGQGDMSVYGDLLFMSVEMPNARLDCGTVPPAGRASPERFRGVRIFDISNIDDPVQIAAVQTCRGSHTHTLVTDPDDDENVYVYVSGTSPVRPAEELEGCVGGMPDENPETALFRIEVIQVPLDSPEDARIVNMPRIFADPETGEIAGLWRGGAAEPGAQETRMTNQCHDITVYPAIGLGAGACSGNGILLDITNPESPERVDAVFDENFAYWHSATFDNEGEAVIFTDEWGGGAAPRCLPTDDPQWGANAIFRLDGTEMDLASYYKLPAPQTELENCVAHNGSLVPVPGRDIMAQAWYQGGISVFDFTDPENPYEIAFFDRGPISGEQLLLAGFWSGYWYNGQIYASEIGRGLDVFELRPSEHLTENELAAARLIQLEQFNPQLQTRIEWPASFVVARALLDQLDRSDDVADSLVSRLRTSLNRAEGMAGAARRDALMQLAADVARIDAVSRADQDRLDLLEQTLRRLAA